MVSHPEGGIDKICSTRNRSVKFKLRVNRFFSWTDQRENITASKSSNDRKIRTFVHTILLRNKLFETRADFLFLMRLLSRMNGSTRSPQHFVLNFSQNVWKRTPKQPTTVHIRASSFCSIYRLQVKLTFDGTASVKCTGKDLKGYMKLERTWCIRMIVICS